MTGTFRTYEVRDFKPETLDLINAANVFINAYEARGMPMTLRQLYYQLVAQNAIENKKSSYDRLSSVISDGRLAGLISWTALEDRNRALMGLQTWDSPAHAMQMTLDNYRIDKWVNQPLRPEVWVEKAALEGVVGTICHELQVDFFACRGYNSQSEQWKAGRRLAGYIQRGQTPIVLHLGDHDPSGLDMTRDNQRRLSMFAGVPVTVARIALNMNQIEELKLPENPTKFSDSRAEGYVSKYGYGSWELDALGPDYTHKLIEDAVLKLRDQKLWDQMEAQEADDRRRLEMSVDEMKMGDE